MSDSLWPHELQYARPPCPSPSPGVHSFMSIESVMPSSHLILCHPLFLLPPIPPSIRVFSNESTLRMRWPKYWSFSFSIIPSKNIQGWSSLEWTGWISLQSKGLLRVFSNTTVQKHQFFCAQPSLWSNSHIHTWPLEKPWLWLYGPLSAEWWLCFLILCLGWSLLFFQEASVFSFHGCSHHVHWFWSPRK